MSASERRMRCSSGTREVDRFLGALDHPLKPAVEAVRAIVLGASPKVAEGVKWNAPSFRTSEWFATVNVREDAVLLVLHLGAKVKDGSTAGLAIDDPGGLLDWRSKDRALVRFPDLESVRSRKAALAKIVRQWIAHVS